LTYLLLLLLLLTLLPSLLPVCIAYHRGSCAGRDIHLENFSVSNGGKDLIEDASVIMAYGRRYGLIGRNGTG
jgi:ATP-binding cassette subfamily F protein 3